MTVITDVMAVIAFVEIYDKSIIEKMEHMRFELTTSTMRMWRAPNCANAP